MKLVATKERLLKAIQLAEDIINAKNTISILSNILLETTDNGVIITSTDLDVAIKLFIEAKIIEEGSITIYAKTFSDIIRELPNDDIEITVDSEKMVKVNSKNEHVKAEFNIIGIPKNDYPVLPQVEYSNNIKVPQAIFKTMIRKTIFSASKDDEGVALSGVKLELKENKLRLVATDARRLSLMDYEINNGDNEIEVIIPQKVLSELLKILSDEGMVDISISENQIYFKIDNIELISRLIDGKYPDYSQVIPTSFEKKVVVYTNKMYVAVKRVSLLPKDKNKAKVTCKFTKNKLELISIDPEIGEAKEEIEILYDYEDYDIAFSSEFLLDAIKSVDTEKFIFGLNKNTEAAMIKEENNDNFLSLIMPIRLS